MTENDIHQSRMTAEEIQRWLAIRKDAGSKN
jgi:hypothetical protein